MKKKTFFVALACILLMLCLSGCPQSNGSSPETPQLLGSRRFNAIQYDALGNETPIEVTANHIKSTANLNIYLREGQSMASADVNYIADNFERHYGTLTNTYGTYTDFDGNGKIIILLYDINTGDTSGGYFAGYFNGEDLFSKEDISRSNEAEILYVESQVSDDIKNIFDTVIHEFQHLINFNMNVFLKSTSSTLGLQSDTWLNEALAESTAIVVSGEMPVHRLATYTNQGSSHEKIAKGNYFYHWDGGLADYATASLFMYWLYLNGEGTTILRNIAQATPAKRGGYEAVLEAVGTSTGSLKLLTSWEDVLFDWLEANENECSGYPDGEYTQEGITYHLLLTSKILDTSGIYKLRSGGAVLSTKKTTSTDSNIAWSKFNSDLVHITLNKNTNVNGSEIDVNLPASPARNTARMMSGHPVLVDEGYRIRHIPQKPLPEGAF